MSLAALGGRASDVSCARGREDGAGGGGALALTPRLLYVGFVGRPGGGPSVAALRLDTGRVTAFAPNLGGVDGVAAIVPLGRIVLIGAYGGGGAYDTHTGKQLTGFANLHNAGAIAVHDSTAYVGGIGGKYALPVGGVLAINIRSGEDRLWFPKIARYAYEVDRIAVSGDRVLVGGAFCRD